MYKVKDNAESQLQFGISSVATTLVVKEGQGAKFPEVPFLVVLNKRNSDGEITKSEKVEVSSVNGDQFTISRGYEGTTPSDFSADDFVSLFVLARHIEELQTEVAKKADQTDVQSVAQRTDSLEEKVETQEQKVGKLEEAGAPGYLSIKGYSKEDIALGDMVVVDNPNVGELSATIMLSVGDIEENKELHVQRLGSGQQLSSIKIPLQKIGNPSDGLLIQVMESKEVTIRGKKHRMGSRVAIATATVRAGDIPSTMTVKDINFSAVKLELGKKYSVVIKRSGNVINNQNFYKIGCLDKRCSSSFELVFGGASPKIRSDFTPTIFVKSSAFFDRMFNKNTPQDVVIKTYNVDAYFSGGYPAQKTYNFTAEANIKQLTWSVGYHHNRSASITITQNGRTFYNKTIPTGSGTYTETFEVDIKPGTFQVTYNAYNEGTLKRVEKLLKGSGGPYTAGQTATIGEQIEAIIYGEFLDRLIGEQIDTTISSSATTGGIPPANAVGYMSILGPNGKKYKIRVYGE